MALVLLACVPLIPASIVAVSRYAKKIFEKYWGKYTSMGDGFLDSVQGLKELKIFLALFLILVAVEFFLPLRAFGAAFHVAMNGVSA